MAVTVTDLARHLGFQAVPSDPEPMQRCLDSAVAVIAPHLVVTDYADNPVYELSVLTVAADFWRLKDAPRGSYGFAEGSEIMPSIPRNTLPAVLPWLSNAGLVRPAIVS